jgi:hypothetical protein
MRKPSPALVISLIALFVALSGTSYAVSKLPKNSVGNKQLKKNAVTSKKVKDRSLLARDFKPGQLPAGAAGAAGTNGARGATGATGPAGPTAVAFSPVIAATALPTDGVATVVASTPASASVTNPGPLALEENSSVIVNMSVGIRNNVAAVVAAACKVEERHDVSWTSIGNTSADIDAGPSRDDTLSFTKGIVLPPETYDFRLACEPSADSALTASLPRITVIATPL